MTEMMSPERRHNAFHTFDPFQRARDLRHAAVGALVLMLFVAGASWLAAHERAAAVIDFLGP